MPSFQEFVAQVQYRGLAKSSNYFVEILPPAGLQSNTKEIQLLPLFCERVNFPEMILHTTQIKDYGLTREVVFDKAYGDVTLSFMCDQQMIIKKFFDAWVQMPIVSNGGIFAYPDKYTSFAMNLYQVDEAKNVVYLVMLSNVYPKIVDDIQASASSRDYNSFQVQFTVESWASYKVDMSLSNVTKPNAVLDIGRILTYAGGISKEGAISTIITHGTQIAKGILLSNANLAGMTTGAPSLANIEQSIQGSVSNALGSLTNSVKRFL